MSKTSSEELKPKKAENLQPKGSADLQKTITKLEDSLKDAESQIKQLSDDKIRQLAEMQNIHSRYETKVQEAHQYSLKKFIDDLLPVIDSLETGIQQCFVEENEATKPAIDGMKVTRDLFLSTLKRHQVECIDPENGEHFNPRWHEAISMQPSDEHPNNSILAVAQKGYSIKDRLIRAAKVIVSQSNP